MDPQDLHVRRVTYRRFVELGRAPTPADVAQECGIDVDALCASWRRLHEQRALVLESGADELRMVNPFSAVPTAYRVYAASRWWYGNCAWDAVGICAALQTDGVIETSCPDCGESIRVAIRDRRPDDDSLFFHCLVPAARWWENIVFT